ncbi:MAG: phage terminase large subunit [Rikenellaceae bacterium]|nr:phage terminase large subunit [Rikenellaceae bacterium]
MKTPSFEEFARTVYPFISTDDFHTAYYRVLEAFGRGIIRKLIITVPPQHGKSLGSSVLLPAYMLGLNPDLRIAIASYSATLASRFNRRVQRLIEAPEYEGLFPDTRIKKAGQKSSFIRTSDQVEIIDHSGELFSVGREGSLTGNRVDIFILDDLYKDAMEANSPVVRENCRDWYSSVVRTRMHNTSQELIVFTRWHEEDLIGDIIRTEKVTELQRWEQIKNPPEGWLHLNFEALKDSEPTEIDPRLVGEPLWAEQHSRELLLSKRRLDPLRFECMYQGHPTSQGGLLYGNNFRTYDTLPESIVKRGNYTDTADTGDDYLCSVCYVMDPDSNIYVTDVVYSREPMEVTERLVADMINRTSTRSADVESNNGGRGFARAVASRTPLARIGWFHQSGNKEARILSNSATVTAKIIMPRDWATKWSDFYQHLTCYKRIFRSNRWHDAADVLTGIVERELFRSPQGKIGFIQ